LKNCLTKVPISSFIEGAKLAVLSVGCPVYMGSDRFELSMLGSCVKTKLGIGGILFSGIAMFCTGDLCSVAEEHSQSALSSASSGAKNTKTRRSKVDTVFQFSAKTLDGQEKKLQDYKGKVVLIVNTASQCGFTPQYKGLEKLNEKYSEQGLAILGFPCNQFGGQEPGESATIANFCQKNYGVSFQMFEKVEVNGAKAHPLWLFLQNAKRGAFNTEAIKWNFTKFLVDKDGVVQKRFAPSVKPEEISADIEKLLK
jgi:glutathione peroxidase